MVRRHTYHYADGEEATNCKFVGKLTTVHLTRNVAGEIQENAQLAENTHFFSGIQTVVRPTITLTNKSIWSLCNRKGNNSLEENRIYSRKGVS